ncbi:hypothetical protein MLD38_016163 [Melastoma candidum]|uniref:Uncharacterized protein n=1 Tax=Melastoma candidum TaxID=119954 RepID=A0ACB9RM67_9MYRT|nr:hypothetical protein MLD38_016163 [Melastoma candidum]
MTTMDGSEHRRKLHAVFLSVPLQGHIRPAINLAIDLASRGITITFIVIRYIHLQLVNSADFPDKQNDQDIFEGARRAGLDIRYEIIDDGLPVEYDRMKNIDQHFKAHIHVFPAHADFVMKKIVRRSDPPVNFLIADTFYTCSGDLAKKYGLVNVSFWTEPALVLCIYNHIDLLKRNGHYACKENRKDPIDYIPGVPAIEPTDLPSYLQDPDASNMGAQFIQAVFDDEKTSDIVIINTIQELELEAIASMLRSKPTYAIGPISAPESPQLHISTTIFRELDCMRWLDTKREHSVLYISFGSFCSGNEAAMREIAHEVLLSMVNFLWVIRDDMDGFLPDGFTEAADGRGLIVPWCNQKKVISHPAVGGFLTHCGWNSILESIQCEVPLICFPLFTDQFTNRRIVVEEFQIGINLHDREEVSRAEVAEKICRVMEGSMSDNLRKNLRERKKAMKDAVTANGSSRRNIREFIDCVEKKVRSKEDINFSNS